MSEIEFLPCIYNIVNNTILKMTKKNAVALDMIGLQRLFFLKSCQKYVFVL